MSEIRKKGDKGTNNKRYGGWTKKKDLGKLFKLGLGWNKYTPEMEPTYTLSVRQQRDTRLGFLKVVCALSLGRHF